MRVISGICRGRRLKAPSGMATRPTSDRVKEAIFNVLAGRVLESSVLDVFAGTGALGIEALSRGASSAVFIENNQAAWQVLNENLFTTGQNQFSQVFRGDYAKVMPRLNGGFDIIFLDPPYNRGLVQPAVDQIISRQLLKPGGLLVLETDAKKREIPDTDFLKLLKESDYGDTAVLYFEILTGGLSCGCD